MTDCQNCSQCKTISSLMIDKRIKNKEYSKHYYKENKSRLLASNKEYRSKRAKYIICYCGIRLKSFNLRMHLKSKQHYKKTMKRIVKENFCKN